MKFLVSLLIGLVTFTAQALPLIRCNDDLSFTPIEFSVIDDDTSGPTIKFSGMYSNQALGALGFLTEGITPWKAHDLVLTLPNQPRKYIYQGDATVRHYTRSELIGTAIVRFQHEGQVVAKAVMFHDLEITKIVTASMGVAYLLELTLEHSGKTWTYRKQYYDESCRLE